MYEEDNIIVLVLVVVISSYSATIFASKENIVAETDVNFDGAVNITDATAIQKYISEIIDLFV